MKKLICVLFAFFFSLIFCFNSFAEVNFPKTVRVGLYYSGSALETVKISGTSDLELSFDSEISESLFEVKPQDRGFILNDELVTDNSSIEFYPTEGYVYVNSKPYRGFIRLINQNEKINVVNVVDTEEYLYGVLPLEMATGWPIEALKGQAVCARNYVATSIGNFERYGFDVTNNTYSQMYGGVSAEKSDCTKAVDETRGVVVMYNGKLAGTYYFATSAGVTLDVKDVWGSTNYPYLSSVDDSIQSTVIANNGEWKVNYTIDEINKLVADKGLGIGDVIDVSVERNKQGAVLKLTLTGKNGKKTYELENTRNFFNLKSQTYDIEKSYDGVMLTAISFSGKETLNNSLKALTDTEKEDIKSFKVLTDKGVESISSGTVLTNVLITGYGNGHGIGFCQNGAKAMAKAGYKYDEILKHYYTGVELIKAY